MRKNYSGKFKAKVVVDVIKEQETVAELSSRYDRTHGGETIDKRLLVNGGCTAIIRNMKE